MKPDSDNFHLEEKANGILIIFQLSELLRKFAEKNIGFVLLKGAGLVETLGDDFFSRPMCDIDILVRKGDMGAVDGALADLGYRFSGSNNSNHATYTKPSAAGAPLEVHWSLFRTDNPLEKYAFRLEPEDFWKGLLPVAVDGATGYGLSVESALIYLSCHLLKESYASVKWVTDIDRLIRRYEDKTDWNSVVERAGRYNVRKCVWHALTRASRAHNTPIPDEVFEKLQPGSNPWFSAWLVNRLERGACSCVGKILLLLLYLSVIERPRDRMRALFEMGPYLANPGCRVSLPGEVYG